MGVTQNFGDDAAALSIRPGRRTEQDGASFGELLKGRAQILVMAVSFGKCTIDCSQRFVRTTTETIAKIAKQLKIRGGKSLGAAARDEFNTPVLANFHTTAHENEADLAG